MMVNHNEFGVTDKEFEANDNDEEKVQELLLKKMCNFITRHPEVNMTPTCCCIHPWPTVAKQAVCPTRSEKAANGAK